LGLKTEDEKHRYVLRDKRAQIQTTRIRGRGVREDPSPNPFPQDGERSKRRPLISIFSHIGMGRRGRIRNRPPH